MKPTLNQAHRAIEARRNGVWDDPDLQALGPLLNSVAADVREIKRLCLLAYGYEVGKRNPQLNTDFKGAYMVAESYEDSELPTRDGSNGPWCIVGDDLDNLIDRAFDVFDGFVIENEYR
jgi:hypothetical protein